MRKNILLATLLIIGFNPMLCAEDIAKSAEVKSSVVLEDDVYDDDENEDDDCCRQRFSIFSNDDMEDDCWYDDTAGWPGLREDTWFRDLEH